MDNLNLKTRVIADEFPNGKWTWRAPIIVGRYAKVELRPTRPQYKSKQSAETSGRALVLSVLPGIVFE